MRARSLAKALAAAVLLTVALAAPARGAEFGFLPGEEGFAVEVLADGGAPATEAGSHPYQLSLEVGLNRTETPEQPGVEFPAGDLREVRIELPPGLLANADVIDRCTVAEFNLPRESPFATSRSGESCPVRSQVGTVEVRSSLGGGQPRRFGLFNLAPSPGVQARLGFAPYGEREILNADVEAGPDGSYALVLSTANFPQSVDLSKLEMVLWGTPWAASHDGERGNCLNEAEPSFPWAKCSAGEPLNFKPLAFLSLPATCSQPLVFTISARAWNQPGEVTRSVVPIPGGMEDCTALPFGPDVVTELTGSRATSPSGFAFALRDDQSWLTTPGARAPTQTRRAVVALPEGVTINPSLGAGLGSCGPSEYAAESAAPVPGNGCPNVAKIGDFSVRTPLVEEPLDGAIYLARPDDPATSTPGAENPLDSLIAVYMVARSPLRGVLVKFAGKLVPDPSTGRLTATFEDLPQLPYEELQLTFRSGQRAPLVTPSGCGEFITAVDLSPWAGTAALHTSSPTQIEAGVDGGPCPAGVPPFSPGVVAGGVNSNVNSYTPYYVHLSRRDDEQEITAYSLVLPEGVTGKLAGIPLCPDAAIEAARSRPGTLEAADPSCPAASRVGRTLSGYGVGAALAYAPGSIYLAGPYHGSALSLVTINSAVVGPFDLGTVVVRSAFAIDPLTAQLRIDSSASDPIPHILKGIPLHLRDIRVYVDRPEFTHNPSSCEASKLLSTVSGSGASFGNPADDSRVTLEAPFQLLNCRTLGFRPRLGLRLRGGSGRGQYPSLRVTFAARGQGDSNLKRIAVEMPHSQFLAQEHIREICTMVQFAADRCPPGSVYGKAVAYTPLLDQPLRGSVYLRASRNKLPDLVASLHSGTIRIDLIGRIGPGRQGGIRTEFDNLPDQPLDRFVMTLFGGRRGLLVNSTNLCVKAPRAFVKALGQNNLGRIFESKLRAPCPRRKSR